MIKKYIKKSMIVTGEQFDKSLPPAQWPPGVEADLGSPTGYLYKAERADSVQEDGDPAPKVVEIKITISDKDFIIKNSRGETLVKGETEFNNECEVLT